MYHAPTFVIVPLFLRTVIHCCPHTCLERNKPCTRVSVRIVCLTTVLMAGQRWHLTAMPTTPRGVIISPQYSHCRVCTRSVRLLQYPLENIAACQNRRHSNKTTSRDSWSQKIMYWNITAVIKIRSRLLLVCATCVTNEIMHWCYEEPLLSIPYNENARGYSSRVACGNKHEAASATQTWHGQLPLMI